MVRNRFERATDIGFLATEQDIWLYIGLCATAENITGDESARVVLTGERECIRTHFAEYAAKYSMYFDIILLDMTGQLLARFGDKEAAGWTTVGSAKQ